MNLPQTLTLLALATSPLNAATLHVAASFQHNTTSGWTSGPPDPQKPSVVQDTGPTGPGDHHLGVFASGTAGPGGRLATFNESPAWTGNYSAAGITHLIADLRNIGGGTLTVRVALDGPGGRYSTTTTAVLPTPSLWTPASFSLAPNELVHVPGTGSGNPLDTLANVSQLRIIHNPVPAFKAIASPASLAVDNLSLIPEPSTTLLLTLTFASVALSRRLPLW